MSWAAAVIVRAAMYAELVMVAGIVALTLIVFADDLREVSRR